MSTAVILAARKERESEVPYPLRTFATGGASHACLKGHFRYWQSYTMNTYI